MAPRLQSRLATECFGGNLYQQGRGFYAGLELLAIVRGVLEYTTREGRPEILPRETETPLKYLRRSHDFARRMPRLPEDSFDAEDKQGFDGPETRRTLISLVEGLLVPTPGSRTAPVFNNRFLFPFVGELIHHDAVDGRKSRGEGSVRLEDGTWLSLERYTYRGAGGLAHKILRSDPDDERLNANRAGLERLVENSGSALGQLANAMSDHDRLDGSRPFPDLVESEAQMAAGGERWADHMRAGVRNITARTSLPSAKRVLMLLHWVPYCLARYQVSVAASRAESTDPLLPIDLLAGANPIRRQSQQVLNACPGIIRDAIAAAAGDLASKEDDADRRAALEAIAKNGQGAGAGMKDLRAFFTSTLFAVGALNAPSGLRHFTFKLPFVEAMVAASLRPGQEVSFETFCGGVLLDDYGLVVDGGSARRTELSQTINTAEFDTNAEVFARYLRSLGLLTEYSDDTRMVHAEVL